MTNSELSEVTCVIPTHARPHFLRESLDSVARQTTPPAAVFVVSDCDDPESELLCMQVASRVSFPVTFVRNPGSGASSSRNLGAEQAQTSHLAFLDDDDLWQSHYVEHAMDALASSAADAVVTWLRMFRDQQTAPGVQITEGLIATDVGAENPGMTGSNVILSRAAFDDIGGFDIDLPVKNDGDFFYRLLLAQKSYCVNARDEVLQRKHSDGQLTGRTQRRADGLELYLAKHRSRLSRKDRRLILLSVQRIRYHAARNSVEKAGHLAMGLFYSSPSSLISSVRNRRTKSFWMTTGFADHQGEA